MVGDAAAVGVPAPVPLFLQRNFVITVREAPRSARGREKTDESVVCCK
jgi:hypothetical protein